MIYLLYIYNYLESKAELNKVIGMDIPFLNYSNIINDNNNNTNNDNNNTNNSYLYLIYTELCIHTMKKTLDIYNKFNSLLIMSTSEGRITTQKSSAVTEYLQNESVIIQYALSLAVNNILLINYIHNENENYNLYTKDNISFIEKIVEKNTKIYVNKSTKSQLMLYENAKIIISSLCYTGRKIILNINSIN
jgi:hypothetical protein